VAKAKTLFDAFLGGARDSVRAVSSRDGVDPDISLYYELQKAMLDMAGDEEVNANYWQNYMCKLIGPADNAFSRMAERGSFVASSAAEDAETRIVADDVNGTLGAEARASVPANMAEAVFALAVKELSEIRRVYNYDFSALCDAISDRIGVSLHAENFAALPAFPAHVSRRQGIHAALFATDPVTAATRLARYYRSFGAGAIEGYDAFRWVGDLRGVDIADTVTMDDLIGCAHQKRALIENTEFLLEGLPSNNVLLYGDSGTGKSSSVKALLNRYKDRGLKLISVPKERIGELTEILECVGGRGLKFILFIDDLSFEENEVGYKSFKSVMEGNVGARAANTLICVTSNRRNIVKEVWKDREAGEDIHLRDNLQEKRSLADRFGLVLVYVAPDKREYLEIVTALARKAGLNKDEAYIEEQALIWELRHGGRSGRTAKQFIDHMIGVEASESFTRQGGARQ
jgi:predicted AAA+ superfamily ATPase